MSEIHAITLLTNIKKVYIIGEYTYKSLRIGYIDNYGKTWKSNIYSVPIKGGPDGGAFTTVHDLGRFWDALFDHQLLSKEYTTILLTPHIKDNDQ
ncbi:hypothetical protein M5X02_25450, partial [Paenibacillus alvei]|nr:hypothetical protein [Paenibacillus alvei]